MFQRLLQCVSPEHGQLLLYVWAIEQDELSKRNTPLFASDVKDGQDVFVPYVISSQTPRKPRVRTKRQKDETVHIEDSAQEQKPPEQVFHRYYHMFSNNELQRLVHEAAGDLGLVVGPKSHFANMRGVEIVQEGWERSNYFVETRCWKS
jgi:tRNA (uracil-5-)-methyltransferase TRM9